MDARRLLLGRWDRGELELAGHVEEQRTAIRQALVPVCGCGAATGLEPERAGRVRLRIGFLAGQPVLGVALDGERVIVALVPVDRRRALGNPALSRCFAVRR